MKKNSILSGSDLFILGIFIISIVYTLNTLHIPDASGIALPISVLVLFLYQKIVVINENVILFFLYLFLIIAIPHIVIYLSNVKLEDDFFEINVENLILKLVVSSVIFLTFFQSIQILLLHLFKFSNIKVVETLTSILLSLLLLFFICPSLIILFSYIADDSVIIDSLVLNIVNFDINYFKNNLYRLFDLKVLLGLLSFLFIYLVGIAIQWNITKKIKCHILNDIEFAIYLVLMLILAAFLSVFTFHKFNENIVNIYKHPFINAEQYELYNNFLSNRKKNLPQIENISSKEDGLFVLVITNGISKNHLAYFGYEKNTTPNLNKILYGNNFIFFKNAYTSSTHNDDAFSMLLTQKNQYDNSNPLSAAVSLIDIAKKAGFETYWISANSLLENGFVYTNALASSSDYKFFRKDMKKQSENEYLDEIVLKHIPNDLNKGLMGSSIN